MATPAVRAQQNDLVIHLYVDPACGQDWSQSSSSVNGFFNPDGIVGPECSTSTVGPHSILEFGAQGGDPLLHAPYPFRTITGALAYVRNRLAPGGGPPLPHTDQTTGKTWSYCIIHLLPGWYGRPLDAVQFQPSIDPNNSAPSSNPLNAQPPRTHLDSKLVPNGETFPIHLPPRVSLAGTSALNTIISTGQVGTAIEFGKVVNNTPISGVGTFIDKVTFYACGGREPNNPSFTPGGVPEFDPRKCAAILIDDEAPSAPTISNCVFVKNVFGVLVNAQEWPAQEATEILRHDGTTIVNCTFAWNKFGLWNGQIDYGNNSIGVSKLNLINNIFDGTETVDSSLGQTLACHFANRTNASFTTGNPYAVWSWPNWQLTGGWQLSGLHSAFEGIAQVDMQVVVGAALVDTNAYETSPATGLFNHNRRQLIPLANNIAQNIPRTTPRSGPIQFSPAPGRDIAAFTGFPTPALGIPNPAPERGVLFVTDLFCRGSHASIPAADRLPSQAGFDLSPLDFRLSPVAMAAWAPPGLPPVTVLNPLVDAGFGGPFPAVMANGNSVQRPGTLAGQSTWAHDCWESDMEGYGNPRIHNHPAYANTFLFEAIDIGADELAELIKAGYRMMTTTFLRLNDPSVALPGHPDLGHPAATNEIGMPTVANDRVVYLGPSAALAGPIPGAVAQPSYRWLTHYGSGQFALTAYPGGYGTSVTWHSAEIPTFYSSWSGGAGPAFSVARPYYAMRMQRGASRLQPVTTPPPSYTAILDPAFQVWELVFAVDRLGLAYRATAAEVTPSLRPDIHPWWTELMPLLGGFDLYAGAPSFGLWQDHAVCAGSNYLYNSTVYPSPAFPGVVLAGISVRNSYLYDPPADQDIAPPGGGVGFTDAATGFRYHWLDEVPLNGLPLTAAFHNWSATPLAITDFNVLGVGGTGTVRNVLLPSTRVTDNPPTVSEVAALRFSVEWRDNLVLWQVAPGDLLETNLQSFVVAIDGQ